MSSRKNPFGDNVGDFSYSCYRAANCSRRPAVVRLFLVLVTSTYFVEFFVAHDTSRQIYEAYQVLQ